MRKNFLGANSVAKHCRRGRCKACVAPTALWIFLHAHPDLPVWANLCRAYGAESGIGASSTRRIKQKLKEPARCPPTGRQAGVTNSTPSKGKGVHLKVAATKAKPWPTWRGINRGGN